MSKKGKKPMWGGLSQDAHWEQMLAALVRFQQRHGHCQVPKSPPGEPALARWVAGQRKLKRAGDLRPDRQQRLEAIGFPWEVRQTRIAHWERRYAQLLRFRRRHGHSCVPAEWRKDRGFGAWVVKQRRHKRAGRLSAERIRRLDEIGFVWEAIPKREADHEVIWTARLAALAAFHDQRGHWGVPTNRPEFHGLRVWMDNQRISYQRGWLSAERIRRLNEIGFPWFSKPMRQARLDARWNQWLERLVAFHREHGHWCIPIARRDLWGVSIWLRHQRNYYRLGTLPEDRLRRLQELGVPLQVPKGYPPRLKLKEPSSVPAKAS